MTDSNYRKDVKQYDAPYFYEEIGHLQEKC